MPADLNTINNATKDIREMLATIGKNIVLAAESIEKGYGLDAVKYIERAQKDISYLID